MGFIHRARRIEARRRAALAVGAQASNEPTAPAAQGSPTPERSPHLPRRDAEPAAPARASQPLTFLASAASFEGEMRTQGDLRIEGSVKGVIHSQEGCLTIGAEARIEADLVVRDVIIEGLVEGDVDASGKAVIRPGGVMHGDLRTQRIQIDDGAVMVGSVRMGEDRLIGESAPIRKTTPAKLGATPEAAA